MEVEIGESRIVDGIVDADERYLDNATYHEEIMNNVGSIRTNIDEIDSFSGNNTISGLEFAAFQDSPELYAGVNSDADDIANNTIKVVIPETGSVEDIACTNEDTIECSKKALFQDHVNYVSL
eukprot:GHVR01084282.1.p1 GENE.GHVR01084282.1~~GHVR01084282.1.p1  ORF type:complete len:123 (+),score=13.49 GHVR01084282.1:338-706(+)